MKLPRHLLCLACLPVALLAVEPDPDLPQPFDPASLAPVAASSPFTRMVNVSDNLVLTGIAYIDGKPVATLFNRETKESHIVSGEPNFQGWVLNEALPAPDITRSRALITIGGEQVKVGYASLTADDMKADGKRGKGDKDGGGGGGDKFKGGSRGPSEEDRKRYESLSEKARDKFRDMMRSKFSDEKFRNAPEEERRNVIRKEFERIEKEDKGGK
ncbi:MAG: hypothetical protein NTV80_04665 [Verrucomicrobia bacterium]|nr:hypothetical protein [Verrucomicrobiota bacterium]